ncbi:hypothetical protein OIU84_025645 [Salix udensis]|uniref:Pentatricopeptide repeat-containing protein n=1 Tax=Salix udensis TaxID=889485 RepID=A0AAD6KK19_9ROSI|nr:hypothetical protein OIU84_025645 [Salix udensis]
MCQLLSRYQFKGTLAFFKSHHKLPVLIISRRSFRSSSETYFHLIETYGRDRALQQGKKLHSHLIINGLARLTHFASKLISFYAEAKQLSDARKLFDKIPDSNIRRWIVLIGAYSRRGFYQEALTVFHEMQKQGLGVNKFVIPSVLKCCGHVYDVQSGRILHSVILKNSIESDVYVISSLIDMYSKCGEVLKARRVFDRMVVKDLVALNAMLSGYVQHGFAKEGFALMDQMEKLGFKPNIITWNSLISGVCAKGG